jgi:polyphenol oxidase
LIGWIEATFEVPAGVRAGTTTRVGGASAGPLSSLNLAAHVGDDPACVRANRERLRTELALPSEPFWLRQVHGTSVAVYDPSQAAPEADAAVCFKPNQVLAVLTADCLPVVFVGREGARLGVAHAGWRGLVGGVLEACVAALGGSDLIAWMGPAIGARAFEVGAEVYAAFVEPDPAAAAAFVANARGRWQADLYALARLRLERLGIVATGGGLCTYSDAERFYSHRRDPRSGRLATLVWRTR